MSITITITGNHKFCKANNLVGKLEYDCQMCDWDGITDGCRECGGCGKVYFDDMPFEMNITSSSQLRLWKVLGLACEESGQIDALALVNRIFNVNWQAMVATYVCEQDGLEYYSVSPDQARSYFDRLANIAAEALKRNESVVWG